MQATASPSDAFPETDNMKAQVKYLELRRLLSPHIRQWKQASGEQPSLRELATRSPRITTPLSIVPDTYSVHST